MKRDIQGVGLGVCQQLALRHEETLLRKVLQRSSGINAPVSLILVDAAAAHDDHGLDVVPPLVVVQL